MSNPGDGNDYDNDGDVDNKDLRKVFDWGAWNDEAEESLNYWNNRYDRGDALDDCVDPCSPATTGTTGTTGTSGTSGQPEPEPEVYYCPRITDFRIEGCSNIEIYIKGGRDGSR